jgi:hypothetical protein
VNARIGITGSENSRGRGSFSEVNPCRLPHSRCAPAPTLVITHESAPLAFTYNHNSKCCKISCESLRISDIGRSVGSQTLPQKSTNSIREFISCRTSIMVMCQVCTAFWTRLFDQVNEDQISRRRTAQNIYGD